MATRTNQPHPMTAELLRKKRELSGLNQRQFMKQYDIKVTQPVFSRWETGEIAVPVQVLLKLGLIAPIEPT